MIDIARKILGLPIVASEHGMEVDKLIIYVHVLMLVLFIGWGAFFIFTLIKFRQSARPKADYFGVRGHYSSYIELAVVVFEAVLLVGFAVPLWANGIAVFPKAADATNIDVIAQQFAWNVLYPGPDGKFGRRDMSMITQDNPWGYDKSDPNGKDDFSTLDEIHVPVGKPVIINITSKDVIHSFKVIAMRVTQDAIPGLRIPMHFTPIKTGIYQINCAQLCGIGHSTMAHGRLIVESQTDYDKWVASKSKAAGTTATSFE
jgi:cytochrome c oxidase subunit 2